MSVRQMESGLTALPLGGSPSTRDTTRLGLPAGRRALGDMSANAHRDTVGALICGAPGPDAPGSPPSAARNHRDPNRESAAPLKGIWGDQHPSLPPRRRGATPSTRGDRPAGRRHLPEPHREEAAHTARRPAPFGCSSAQTRPTGQWLNLVSASPFADRCKFGQQHAASDATSAADPADAADHSCTASTGGLPPVPLTFRRRGSASLSLGGSLKQRIAHFLTRGRGGVGALWVRLTRSELLPAEAGRRPGEAVERRSTVLLPELHLQLETAMGLPIDYDEFAAMLWERDEVTLADLYAAFDL